jgi:hypothetical protein
MRSVFAAALCFAFAATARAQAADPLYDAVDAYARYQTGVSVSLDAHITSPAAVDDALNRAAAFDAEQLTRGRMAYLALTAAQSPAFVHGVQARVHAASRAAVIRQLVRDPTYARRRPAGASEALDLILLGSAADSARLAFGAAHYEEIGTAIGAASWNTPLDPAMRDARGAHLRSSEADALTADAMARVRAGVLAAAPLHDPAAFGGAHFWDALAGRAPAAPQPGVLRLRTASAPIIDRALTLAALFVVGATAEQRARVDALLDDPPTRECLALQQLELRQCVSVSHTPDEDVFCLAQHGMTGPSQCFNTLAQ